MRKNELVRANQCTGYAMKMNTGAAKHVFNAVNQGGTIRFLDAQSGGLGVNNFNNFQNFQFLLTHP
jgi:hypothetical protein